MFQVCYGISFLFESSMVLLTIKELISQKFKKRKELEKMLQFSYFITKSCLKMMNSRHQLISASSFTIILLSLEIDGFIPISNLCNTLNNTFDASMLPRGIKKIDAIVHNKKFDFDNLEVTSE